MVGLQALQARLAGALDPAAARILGVDLADQEDLIADAGQGLAEKAFGGAIAVHLGGVDQGHPQVDAGAQRGDFLFAQARILAHAPRALAERGNGCLVGQGHRAGHAPNLARRRGDATQAATQGADLRRAELRARFGAACVAGVL